MKSIGIVPMHLEKILLKYGGVVPTRSVSRGLRRGGHTMGRGGVVKMARTKNYVGIQYGLHRNSMELDKTKA